MYCAVAGFIVVVASIVDYLTEEGSRIDYSHWRSKPGNLNIQVVITVYFKIRTIFSLHLR